MVELTVVETVLRLYTPTMSAAAVATRTNSMMLIRVMIVCIWFCGSVCLADSTESLVEEYLLFFQHFVEHTRCLQCL